MSLLVKSGYSVALYRAIAYCDWVGGGTLGCPALAVALSVRTFFEEALSDKFFQVSLEASARDGPVSHTFVERTILFYSRKCMVVLDWLQAFYSRLVF